MDETIKTILYYWIEKDLPEIKERETDLQEYLDILPGKIPVVTGFRRTGKTFVLYDLIRELLGRYSKEELIYINFNDERIPRETRFLSDLIPTIRSTFDKSIRYLFLDELQEMPEWSKWLRRINDNEDIRIFVTGSSSKVSSKEMPTELRGRGLEIELYPLSFREFLGFNGISADLNDIRYRENELAGIKRYLDKYLKYGGMPEVVLAPESLKIEILQDYYRTVVARDVVERYDIKNEEALKAMILLLINSSHYSVSKMNNTLRSLGHRIGKTTMMNYIGYLSSSYFLQPVEIFSTKVKDSMQYQRKPYFIDNGFITALSTKMGKDLGRKYENCVAVELMRRGFRDNLYYWKNDKGWEVDFVLRTDEGVKKLIQVSYDIDDMETKDREIRALYQASKELGCEDLTIINGNAESFENYSDIKIKVIPLWKFLLDKDQF
jgi:hypothetical protein